MAYELDETGQPKKKLAAVGGMLGQDDAQQAPLAQPGAPQLPASTAPTPLGPVNEAKGASLAPVAGAPPPANLSMMQNAGAMIGDASPALPATPAPQLAGSPPPATTGQKSLSDMSEAEKTAYWAGQGVQGLAGVGYTPSGKYDAGANATATSDYLAKNKALVDSVTNQVQGSQTADLNARNAASQATNFDQAMQDSTANIASTKKAGGVYSSPEDEANAFKGLMQKSGFTGNDSGAYTWTGEPANNPNATPGMPEIKGVTPQAQPTGPGQYIVGGQVYDNPQGTGTPIRPAPGTPTTNTSAGGATAQTAGGAGSQPTLTTFDETNNLRDKQINPNSTDRGAIAQKYLDAFDTRSEAGLRDKLRSVGQRAASLGRIGMGDTAAEAMTPYTDYLKERAALSSELAGKSAEGQIGDEANARNEYRTERGYQDSMSRQAIQDAINQWQMGEQSKNSEFGRNATTAGLLFNASNGAGSSAGMDFNTIAGLLTPYLYKNKAA